MYNVLLSSLGINTGEIDQTETNAHSFALIHANMSDLDPASLFGVKSLVAVVTGGGTGAQNHP
jgi:hypothetical protein